MSSYYRRVHSASRVCCGALTACTHTLTGRWACTHRKTLYAARAQGGVASCCNSCYCMDSS